MRLVKKLLKTQERSQAWLSRRCGVTPAMMSYWMSGKHKPSIVHKKAISDAFGLEVSDVFK